MMKKKLYPIIIALLMIVSGCVSSILVNSVSVDETKNATQSIPVKEMNRDELKEKRPVVYFNTTEEKENTTYEIVPREEREEKEKKEEKEQKNKKNIKSQKETVKEKTAKEEPKQESKKAKNTPKFTTEKTSGEFMSEVDLNIRKGPSTDYSQIGHLKPHQKATATEKTTLNNSTWYKISVGKVTGWASANYLKPYKKVEKTKEVKKKASKPSQKYQANHLYFSGRSVPYKNGGKANGQAIIDSSNYASTWGGASTFSGSDGKNTHFIGHSPGNFTGIQNAKSFIVTDGNGTPFTYKVTRIYKVNGRAIGIKDGKNYFDRIAGTGGGERITIQTCIIGTDDQNWIIEAHP